MGPTGCVLKWEESRFPSFGFLCVGDNEHKPSTLEHGKLSPLHRRADSTPRLAARCHPVSTQQGSSSPVDTHKEKALLSAQHPAPFLLDTHTFLLEIQERSSSKTCQLSEESPGFLPCKMGRGVTALRLTSPMRN